MEIIGWIPLAVIAGLMAAGGVVCIYGVVKYITGWIRGRYR